MASLRFRELAKFPFGSFFITETNGKLLCYKSEPTKPQRNHLTKATGFRTRYFNKVSVALHATNCRRVGHSNVTKVLHCQPDGEFEVSGIRKLRLNKIPLTKLITPKFFQTTLFLYGYIIFTLLPYYLGILTLDGKTELGELRFKIPTSLDGVFKLSNFGSVLSQVGV